MCVLLLNYLKEKIIKKTINEIKIDNIFEKYVIIFFFLKKLNSSPKLPPENRTRDLAEGHTRKTQANTTTRPTQVGLIRYNFYNKIF